MDYLKARVIAMSFDRLTENKPFQINLISFFDRLGRLVGRGNATDKMCLDFRKTSDRVSYDVLVGTMKIYELGDS